MLDLQLLQFTVLALRVNGFPPIAQSMSLEDVTGSLSGQVGFSPEAYCRRSEQDSAVCYIRYGRFVLLHDAIENKDLYE